MIPVITWRDIVAMTWRRVALVLVSAAMLASLLVCASECRSEPATQAEGCP